MKGCATCKHEVAIPSNRVKRSKMGFIEGSIIKYL